MRKCGWPALLVCFWWLEVAILVFAAAASTTTTSSRDTEPQQTTRLPSEHQECHDDNEYGQEEEHDLLRISRNSQANSTTISTESSSTTTTPPDCRVVMAKSDLGGWGIFVLDDFVKHQPLLYGDVVIQVADAPISLAVESPFRHYLWDAHDTLGMYMGMSSVYSVLPGIGMLANGHDDVWHNVLPSRVTVDDGGLRRATHAGAGAITHFCNVTFHVQRDKLTRGSEVLVHYGPHWFQTRHNSAPATTLDHDKSTIATMPPRRSVDELRKDGYCLDTVRPGPSLNPEAGRGVFATRRLPQNTIVMPVPVLPLFDKERLLTTRFQQHDSDTPIHSQQLWLNYCLGHRHSSLLLYPYSPTSNLVNHNRTHFNAQWRWNRESHEYLSWPLERLKRAVKQDREASLLLELVATRDIEVGEELYVDYGLDWEEAWNRHVEQFQQRKLDQFAREFTRYTPSHRYRHNRTNYFWTRQELRQYPYPDHIFTSCYYDYLQGREYVQRSPNVTLDDWPTVMRKQQTSSNSWQEGRYLRPCTILERHEREWTADVMDPTNLEYTVQIHNRFNLMPTQRLPKQHVHMVTRVPHKAIMYSDKLYTTDQHLQHAFRHYIGLSDEVFPKEWMDLKK